MGLLLPLTLGIALVSILLFYIYSSGGPGELPNIKLSYWGPGKQTQDDKAIKPFKIAIPDEELKVLRDKIASTRRLVAPLEGVGFNYGVSSDYLVELVNFWKEKYDWRDRETYLNSLPQYTTQIGGLKIHFIHAKPDPAKAKGKRVLPLLLIHGWPGSVREFYEIIPLLTKPRADTDFVFEVVAPSLPGYGFSESASKPGLGTAHIAPIFAELMTRLGHTNFYIQGGDWGSAIGQSISVLFPSRVLGFHSNFCLAQSGSGRLRTLLVYLFPSFFLSEDRQAAYKEQFADTIFLEMGYFHLQATKPDTVGVALTDSPVGLAAYLVEKFATWTNRSLRHLPDGGLDLWNKAELLDNIMIYWFTNSITTSMRLYSESFSRNSMELGVDRFPVTVPVACAQFPNELLFYPKYVLEAGYQDIVSITDMPRGGHFAAFQEPQLLADDVWKFVKTLSRRRIVKK